MLHLSQGSDKRKDPSVLLGPWLDPIPIQRVYARLHRLSRGYTGLLEMNRDSSYLVSSVPGIVYTNLSVYLEVY